MEARYDQRRNEKQHRHQALQSGFPNSDIGTPETTAATGWLPDASGLTK